MNITLTGEDVFLHLLTGFIKSIVYHGNTYEVHFTKLTEPSHSFFPITAKIFPTVASLDPFICQLVVSYHSHKPPTDIKLNDNYYTVELDILESAT